MHLEFLRARTGYGVHDWFSAWHMIRVVGHSHWFIWSRWPAVARFRPVLLLLDYFFFFFSFFLAVLCVARANGVVTRVPRSPRSPFSGRPAVLLMLMWKLILEE